MLARSSDKEEGAHRQSCLNCTLGAGKAMAQSHGSGQGFQRGLGMMASRKELRAPTALPRPLPVTLSGPSVFLPPPDPPLAALFSVQQPQFGKRSSREQGFGDPAGRAARSREAQSPWLYIVHEARSLHPRGPAAPTAWYSTSSWASSGR